MLAGAAAVVLLIAQAGASSNPAGFTCQGTAFYPAALNNWNSDGTSGGGTPVTFDTGSNWYCVTEIDTYHDDTAAAGTVSLTGVGTVPATVAGASGGFENWLATPTPGDVIHGSVTCDDSDHATWQQNAASNGGFCKVQVQQAVDDTAPLLDWGPLDAQLHGDVSIAYSASDLQSGIAEVDVQTSPAGADTWTTRQVFHSGDTVWHTANTPDGTWDVRLLAVNGTGGTAETSPVTVSLDNTGPAITLQCDLKPCDSNWHTSAISLTAADSDPAGTSGQLLYVEGTALPFGNPNAQAYTGAITVDGPTTFTFGAVDTLGNTSTATVTVDVDTTDPPAPHVGMDSADFAFLKATRAAGYVVWYNPAAAHQVVLRVPANDDPESGLASVSWPSSFGQFPGWTITPDGTTATIGWAPQLNTGPSFSVTSTNNAGLTSTASDIGFSVDPNPPSGGVTCSVASCANQNGPVTVTASVSDSQSGIRDIRYTTDGTTPSATTGTPGTSVTLNHNATVTFWAIDNVGNAGVVATQPVQATPLPGDFTVDTTDDTPDANVGDGNCADANGKCSLRAAVQEADALPDGTAIDLPAGTYGLGSGELALTKSMAIAGAGRGTLVQRATDTPSFRVFDIQSGTATLSGLDIEHGDAQNGIGGGIYVANGATLNLTDSTVANNTAFSSGGGIDSNGKLNISGSTIANNQVTTGGLGIGGGIDDFGTGLSVVNSTIAGNSAPVNGGGVESASPATFVSVTIADNRVDPVTGQGGGVFGYSTNSPGVSDSIIANNTGGDCGGANIGSQGFNLFSDQSCTPSDGDVVGADPLLGPLQDNGGPTDTLLPGSGSDAIDGGPATGCPAADQRGIARPQGARCDIGAVEIERIAAAGDFTVDFAADTHDATPGDGLCADANGHCTLRAAVEEADALPAGSAITVPAGDYQLGLRQSGFGSLTVSTALTIAGAGARTTTVGAPGDDRAIDVAAAADPVTISGLTISGGLADDSNGDFGGNVRNQGTLTLSEDTISNGVAGSGAGVGNVGGTLLIDRSTIANNDASVGGGDSGGVQDWGDGTHHGILTIRNSTISGNNARLGGGIFVWNDPGNTVTITDSTIAANNATDRGIGGIGIVDGASAVIRNSVVDHNTVFGDNTVNCSVAGASPSFQAATLTSLGHNLSSNGDCPFTAAGDIENVGAQLGALGNNGGQTDTMLPAAGSPVIDAGDDANCPATDQIGTSRPQGGHCDIGAVEAVRAAAAAFVVTTTADSGAGSLRAAVTAANASPTGGVVTFAIPGSGVQTISPLSALPALGNDVTIDGYTQPGAQPATNAAGGAANAVLEIVLDGSHLSSGAALRVTGANDVVRGLVVNGGSLYGLQLDGATNATVAGNYIGTSADGLTANGFGQYGIDVRNNASGNTIGGTAPADRNIVSGTFALNQEGGAGIDIALGANHNTLLGNLIGTSATVTTALPNGRGIIVQSGAHDNAIGDGNKADGNIVGFNHDAGIWLDGSTATAISGNWVGVDFIPDGAPLVHVGNGGDGIDVDPSTSAVIGQNVIANNSGNGITVLGNGTATITQNTIRNSGELGIDLGGDGVTANDAGDGDTGPNGLQNFPVITKVTSDGTVSGTLDSAPSSTYTVEVFSAQTCNPSGNGEANAFVGSARTVQTDANGHATFVVSGAINSAATAVTATATDSSGETSEFSSCFQIALASQLVVNSADDHDDGACTASDCTLREAINAANAATVPSTIRFAIGTGGPQVIHLLTPLPAIQHTFTIDGTTQPGWLAAPVITLDGSTLPPAPAAPVDGLLITAPNVTVRGLVVTSFSGSGIHVGANGASATIAGNAAGGNGVDGIRIEGPNAIVGGTSALDRNVVGGNAHMGIRVTGTNGAVVRGNYAGTDAGGSVASPNAEDGISIDSANNNTIRNNVASGNHNQGIAIHGAGNTAYGNLAGLTADGNGALANGGDGIRVFNGTGNTIGGTGTGQANTIADNGGNGVGIYVFPGSPSNHNRISGNSITGNSGAGIHLDAGANDDQPAPAVTNSDATSVTGSLAAAPSTAYTIEVFQNAACDTGGAEGAVYVGSTTATTNANGAATWTLGASVDPGTVATATATAPNGDTSAFSACTSIALSDLHATFTVDQSTTTAGASSFALASLPSQLFTQLATGDPSSAPIPTAPIPTAAVGASPIPTAPIPTAPIPTAPIPTAPIPTAPIPTAPIPTAPIPTAGLFGIPIPTAGIANPLDSVLLSSIPNLDVSKIFACTATAPGETNIAGKLPQQYTLGDVYRSPCATAYFNTTYKASDVPLGGTLLRGVRTLSYLLGGKPLSEIDLGSDWCTALTNAGGSCAGVDTSQTTVVGLDIMHQLGTLDLGQLTVSDLTNGLARTLVGQAMLARIAFQQTTIANISTGLVPTAVSCAPSTCPTLGDAARLNAVNDNVTLASLPQSALANVTLSELVVALTPRNALPWEQESFLGWQGFSGQAQKLQYHLDFDATCPITTLSVRIRLPFGFVYVPGSSTVQLGSGTPAAIGNPSLDPKNGATYTNIPAVGCPTGSQHIRLNFQGEAGYRLGASLSTAIITVDGQSTKITDAPVFVDRNFTAALDRSTEPQIAPDTIYLSHVAAANGTNYFKLPEVRRGELVTIYMRPPAGSDFDLYVVRPSPSSLLASPIPTAPIPTAPIPTAPIPTAPIPTADTSVNTTTDNPAPELLDDGPLPGGQVSVDSITRGDGVESVTFRQAGDSGFDEIAVAGYNGAFSSDPFELRVVEQDPPPLPATCPDRTLPATTAGTLPVGVDPATQNLALVNVGRMTAMYGSRATTMLADLQTVFSSQNHGVVIPVDGDQGVRDAASAWDHNVCSPDAANTYVHAINALVASYRANLPSLKSITIVGDDEQIPFARVPDFVPVDSEADNSGTLAFLTKGNSVDDAAYAASALGYVLTDDAYGAFHTRTLFGHEFFLPEVALGRLVETPEEIDGQLQQYIGNTSHVLDAHTGFVTGYDFMSDAAQSVDDNLVTRIGAAGAGTNTLLRDTWGKSALEGLLKGTTPAARLNSWNAHYDYHRVMPAVYTGPSDLLSTDIVPASVSQQFGGSIFFTMGCHAGESLDDALLPSSGLTRDWAQTFSQTGAAVFIGNTGFGYGDTASVALSERMMSLFAGHLGFNGSVGEKLLVTKNEYFASMGAYGPYDEKAIEETTFYGLPFWQVNSPSEASATPPGPVSAPNANNVSTAPLTLTPHLTKVSDARGTFWSGGDGTVFVPGRSVQPLVDVDLTQPAGSGLVAHGFFPSGLVTDDSNKNLNLYFAKPMIDQGTHEPEPLVTNDVFPASPVKVAQADYLGQRHSTLDLIAGQSRPGSSPSLQNERLITSLSGVVTYAPAGATDYTPPSFGQTGSFVAGGKATIFATVTDDQAAGVVAVRAFFTNGGPWQFVDLQPASGTPGLWTATNVPVSTDKIEVGFVAEDATGNTGWMTGKGILVDSYTPSSPPPAPSIVIKTPLDGGTYTLGQSVPSSYACTAQAPLTSCAGPVASGSNFDTTTVGTKSFQVTATPLLNSQTTTSKTASYSVVFNFGGFQAPIAANALNVVKAGSSVPVKFSLHGNFGLGILASGYPQSAVIPCTGGTVDTGITTDTAGSSSLQYDAGSDTYTYIWKTQKAWTGCRQLLVVLSDGVVHRANFQFK